MAYEDVVSHRISRMYFKSAPSHLLGIVECRIDIVDNIIELQVIKVLETDI